MIPNKNQATINPWFCLRVPSFKTYATPLIKLFNEVSREIFLFDSQLSRWLKTLHTGIVTRFNFLDASKNRHIKLASYVKFCGFFSNNSLFHFFVHVVYTRPQVESRTTLMESDYIFLSNECIYTSK